MNKQADPPKHSSRRLLQTALLILLIVSLAFASGLAYLGDRINTLTYPRKFRSEVETAASAYGLEPNLIYAIIKAESDFCETAVSSAGAIGLMQVLPDTFIFDIRDQIGMGDKRSAVLFQPEENILAGAYYFSYWYDYFTRVYELTDPVVEALAAYNAGISNVWQWLEDGELADWNGLFVEKIPFAQTKKYVQNVLKYKAKYDELYPDAIMENGLVSEALCYRWAIRYGADYRIDPRLVMAIIKAESSFNPADLSKSGALGLMQIIPDTYVDIKGDLELEEEYEDLIDPEFNVKCGTYYLHWIDERTDGVAQIAAAYNAGITAVNEWLTDPTYSEDGKTLIPESIPVEQTRNYVRNVLQYYEEYCQKYPD